MKLLPTNHRRLWLAAIPVVALCALLGAKLFGDGDAARGPVLRPADPSPGTTPVPYDAPAFALADQDGKPVSKAALRGKIWIADFIFTSCGNTCPKMSAKRGELQKRITDPRVTFVSFSVDPERDDTATRKTYAAKYDIDQARWHFVSPPDRAAAMKMAEAMRIAGHSTAAGHEAILHSDRFILIDAAGRVRDTYLMSDAASLDRLVADATMLAGAASRE